MRIHRYLLVAFLLIVSLALAACSTQTTTPPPTTSVPPTTSAPAATTAPPTTTAAPATSSPATSKPTAPSPSASPSASPTSTSAVQYGGVLKLITPGSPLYLGDPTLITDANSNMGVIPVLQSLVFADNSGNLSGVLATNWTVAPDGKSITFNLRKGVKFHDGTDFNAQAAKWNLDRYLKAFATSTAALWSSIDVVDDYTVRLNLKSFQNTILNALEGSSGMMVSPTAAQKNGIDWIKLNPVGTGPYKFVNFSRDVSLEYTRFDDYWGGKPYLDGVKYVFIADGTTAQLAFQSGVGDVVSTMTDSVTNDLLKKGYKVEKRPGAMMNLIPDSKHATSPWADIKVRQAIQYAIDRQGMANTLGYGLWEVANQPATAAQFGHIDNVPYTYDVAKAKQLMKDSGYPNGFKSSIISSSTFARDPLVAIQAQLAAIGITIDLKLVEFAAWNDYVSKGWDNALLWVTQGATDTNYCAFLDRYYGATATRYPVMAKPAGLGDLINKALASPDYGTQKSLSQQAVKMIVDDSTAIPVYIGAASYVLTNNVHDTNFSNVGGSGFRWSAEKAWLSK